MADRRGVSASNVSTIAAIYRAWEEGRIEAAAELLPDEIVWETPPDSPEPSIDRGRESVVSSMANWTEQWADLQIEDLTLEEHGDRVLASCVQRGIGRLSGVTVEAPLHMLWTMRDGRPVRMQMFLDEAQARATLTG